MNRRFLAIAAAFGFLFAAAIPVGVWVAEKQAADSRPVQERIARMITCLSSDGPASNGRADLSLDQGSALTQQLNNEQWQRVECAVAALGVPRDGVEVERIMKSVIAASQKDEDVMVACHEVGHELGRVSWRELDKSGLVLGLELCTYGYYHGYMREAIVSENGDSRVPFLVEFCDKQAREKTGEFDQVRFDFCAHGVGHAIGSAKFPMDYSVDLCENFPVNVDPRANGGTAGWCITGVYNEMFLWPWADGKETVLDLVKVCDGLPNTYKLHCGQYSVQNSRLDIEKIKATCNSIGDTKLRAGCWQAVTQIIVRKYWFPAGRNNGIEYYKNPAEGAKIISDACAGDATTGCAKEFAADSMSTTQSPDLVIGVCRLLARPADATDCEWQVNAIRGSNTYVE
jgi:hypothetical protein